MFQEIEKAEARRIWSDIERRIGKLGRDDALASLRVEPIEFVTAQPRWVPTTAPVSEASVRDLVERVHKLEDRLGFPNKLTTLSEFDKELSDLVVDLAVPSAWAGVGDGGFFRYLSFGLLQEIGPWRFPRAFKSSNDAPDEVSSSKRRATTAYQDPIGRLWWQHHILGGEASALPEDLIESVLGRPGAVLSSSPTAAKAFVSLHKGQDSEKEPWRPAAKAFLRVSAWLEPTVLDEKSLRALVGLACDPKKPHLPVASWKLRRRSCSEAAFTKVSGSVEVMDAACAGKIHEEWRTSVGLSQEFVAKSARCTQPDISRFEHGKSLDSSKVEAIVSLASVVGCDFRNAVRFVA